MKFLYFLIISVSLSSCGTLFISKEKRETYIESNVPATVYEGDYKLGKTPYKVTTKAKNTTEYIIKADGHRDAVVFAVPSYNNLFEMLDVLGFGIPLYVDGITQGLKYYKEKSLKINLFKKYETPEVRVAVKELSYQIRENEYIGELNTKIKYKRQKFQYYDIIANVLENETNSRFSVLNYKNNVLNNEFESKNKFVLQPEISKLRVKKSKSRHDCSATVNWKLTRNDSILFEQKGDYRYSATSKSSINALMIGIITNSWYAVQEEEELINILKRSPYQVNDNKFTDTLEIKNGEIKLEEKKNVRLSNATKAVVTIKSDDGFGSGFFISTDGYLITNAHVVGKEKVLEVILHDNKKIEADVIRNNEEADLCLLKIKEGKNYSYLPIAKKFNVNIGDEVYAIGTPENLKLSQTLTRGIISAIRKDEDGREIIQSDVSINSGNSGGPLLNDNAEVIGINTSKIKKEGVQGISFSIPINQISKYLLIKTK